MKNYTVLFVTPSAKLTTDQKDVVYVNQTKDPESRSPYFSDSTAMPTRKMSPGYVGRLVHLAKLIMAPCVEYRCTRSHRKAMDGVSGHQIQLSKAKPLVMVEALVNRLCTFESKKE